MDITTIIRKRRTSKGYSQEYISGQLKISQKTYSRYEADPLFMDLGSFLRILTILEISPDELTAVIKDFMKKY